MMMSQVFFGQLILPNICSDMCKVHGTMHVQNVLKKLHKKKKLMQHKKIACSEEYMLQNSQFSIQPN